MSTKPAPRMALIGKIGGHTTHARHDPTVTTAKARATFLTSFELAADPDGTLPVDERQRRAEQLRKAHFARLSLASAEARRQKAQLSPGSRVRRGGSGTSPDDR